jgi:hypothetical protein
MASNITANTIDEAFPVAGVDNDTQGFRDNFSIIKSGLGTAKTEITALQANTAKLNEDNNYNGSQISNAQLIATTDQFFNAGSLNTGVGEISFNNGHYQTVIILNTPGNTTTINLGDWPEEERTAVLRVEVRGNGPDLPIAWTTEGTGRFRFESDWGSSLIVGENPRLYEFWTYTGGAIVYGKYLGEFIDE